MLKKFEFGMLAELQIHLLNIMNSFDEAIWGQSSNLDTYSKTGKSLGSRFAVLAIVSVGLASPFMNWITVRPLGKKIYQYNLWNFPGGSGIVVLSGILCLVGALTLVTKEKAGLVLMSLGLMLIGWLAALYVFAVGFAQQIIPAVDFAGIDLAKSQISPGNGCLLALLSAVWLSFITVTRLVNVGADSRIRVLPMYCLLGLAMTLLLALLQHAPWVSLGYGDTDIAAEVAGSSIFGSSVLEIVAWLGIGLWLAVLISGSAVMSRLVGGISLVFGLAKVAQTVFVFFGISAVEFLLPNYLEENTSHSFLYPMYLTGLVSITLILLGIVMLVSGNGGPKVKLEKSIQIRQSTIPLGVLVASITPLALVCYFLYQSISS
jgi:hypothetical protein